MVLGASLALLAGLGLLLSSAPGAPEAPQARAVEHADVLQLLPDGRAVTVALPLEVWRGPTETGRVQRQYRWEVSLPAAPTDHALFFPGLIAHARILVNGHPVLDDPLRAEAALPRGVDRIVLVPVPDEFWRAGENRIDLEAVGADHFYLSRMELGPRARLFAHRRARVIGVIVGPGIVAAVEGTLGLCVLLLWTRLRESLYAYFGAGAIGYAAHSAWTVLPWSPVAPIHHVIWWTTLYVAFVASLVVFCLRFAGWHWPRRERVLWWLTLATPLVLYAAAAGGRLELATAIWRLGLIAMVGLAVAA
jgi:hypothetical protein